MAGIIALYLRLSKEDEDIIDESNSISNQRRLLIDGLKKYGLENEQAQEYCDDGYSGKNFERPAVKRLLEDVRKGIISTILVKDFSRFGRDHIEVGNYIEKIFPFMNIRFISLNNHFDSIDYLGTTPDMDVSFQNLLYDYYSEETSQKIKATFKHLKQEGKYVSRNPLYGYKKSERDKHQLVIDEEAAKVVRRIFRMRIDGMNGGEISRWLNAEGVLSPSCYSEKVRNLKWSHVTDKKVWIPEIVNGIIKNEQYLGKLVAGKRNTIITGTNKRKLTGQEEWIAVNGTHEAIIDAETFQLAQEKQMPRKELNKVKPKEYYQSVIKGLVRCGGCRHKLTRKAQKNPAYYCKYYYYNHNDLCCETTFPEKVLLEIVLTAIHNLIYLLGNAEKLIYMQQGERQKANHEINQLIEKKKSMIERLENENFLLYEKFSEGKIVLEKYKELKEDNLQLIKTFEKEITEMENAVMQNQEKQYCILDLYHKELKSNDNTVLQSGSNETKVPKLVNYDSLNNSLSEDIVKSLVKNIYIYCNKRVEIEFNFKDEVDELLSKLDGIRK